MWEKYDPFPKTLQQICSREGSQSPPQPHNEVGLEGRLVSLGPILRRERSIPKRYGESAAGAFCVFASILGTDCQQH